MANSKIYKYKLLLQVIIILMAIPSCIYIFILLLPDVLIIFGKVGWQERPFVYMKIESVIIYTIFILTNFIISLEIRRVFNSYITNVCVILIAMSLLLFLFFLFMNIIKISTL